MSTSSLARVQVDETVVRVVRSLMSWHGLAMPDIAAAIDASIGTVERRLSRNPATRKSFAGFELQMLADYFGVPVESFYTGAVDLKASRLRDVHPPTREYLTESRAPEVYACAA